jgi:hypothetical protein
LVSTDLSRIRVRVAQLPRPAKDHSGPAKLPRTVVIVHAHADDREQVQRAIAIELLDGLPVDVVVSEPGGDPVTAQAWAAVQQIPSGPGVKVATTVLDLGRFGRFVVRRCGERRAAFTAFSVCWTVGHLAADVRRPRSGTGLSIGFVGCGWFHDMTRKWMDAYYRPRLRLDPRGEDSGAFAHWIPSRKRRKAKRRGGGPIDDLAVLGSALGCDVESPASLARSLGIDWPDLSDPLD